MLSNFSYYPGREVSHKKLGIGRRAVGTIESLAGATPISSSLSVPDITYGASGSMTVQEFDDGSLLAA